MAEQMFMTLGLTTPARRFAAGSLATGGALVALQPDLMFEDGQPRQWSALTSEADSAVSTTIVPWWMASVGVGAWLGMFF